MKAFQDRGQVIKSVAQRLAVKRKIVVRLYLNKQGIPDTIFDFSSAF